MAQPVKQGLLSAFRHLLRPLVRILLRNGVSIGEFLEAVKTVYVEIAGIELQVPGRKMSQARIAIVTGLTRKEVARIINEEGKRGEKVGESNLNRVTRVLVGWHTDSDFTGPYGFPLELKFDDPYGPTFVELCRLYSGDMPARAMLDELLRVRAVTEVDNAYLKVLTRSYIPEKLAPESLKRFGDVMHDFADTLDLNLRKKEAGAGRFERNVFADDGLRPDDLEAFDNFVRDRGEQFLEEIDNWLSQLPKPTNKDQTIQTGVGLYHYITREEDPRDIRDILGD